MKSGALVAAIVTGTITAIAFANPAAAQQGPLYGRVYSFHSGPAGGCPGVDWHAVVESDGSLSGMVSWDQMKHMARLSGKVNEQATPTTFQATAVEEGGSGRKANITGEVRPEDGWIQAKITGTGTGCDNQTIRAPWFMPTPASQ